MDPQPVYIRLEPDLIERTDAVARRERRSRAAQIATWIEEGLDRDAQRQAADNRQPLEAA